MKRNLGNVVVKRFIASAMATMVIIASPTMKLTATESAPTLSTENVNASIDGAADSAKDFVESDKLNQAIESAEEVMKKVDTITKELDELNLSALANNIPVINDAKNQAMDDIKQIKDHINELEAPILSDEEATLVGDTYTELTDVYNKYSTNGFVDHYDVYNITDDVTAAVNGVVSDSINREMADAAAAIDEAKDKTTHASNVVDTFIKYDTATDTLLNSDNDLIDGVEGNTDNIIEAIEENGEIMVNVEGTDGAQSQKELTSYISEKADSAEAAADVAQDCLDTILNNSNANITEERAKLDQALTDAVIAKTDAENAYSAAQAVLLDQIKRYNAYATLYGTKLYTMEDGSTPTYDVEELTELEGIKMNGTDLNTDLKGLLDTTEYFAEQNKEIEATKRLVGSCNKSLDAAKKAVAYVKGVEENLITNLNKLKEEANAALATATDAKQKELLQKIYDHTNFILTEYSNDLTPAGGENRHPNAANGTIDSVENRIDYALNSADTLTQELDSLVQYANNTLAEASNRYDRAVTDYENLMDKYERYLTDNNIKEPSVAIDANLEALTAKLAEASKSVTAAKGDLDKAVDAVNSANSVKAKFEEAVANKNSNSNSSSNNSGSTASSTNVVVTDANGLASISELTVPLADTVSDVVDTVPATDVPFTEIIDEASPLTDSVPKTGDASATAGAVGAFGLFAMLGALIIGNKKRTLR